jgi:hypothetical protein
MQIPHTECSIIVKGGQNPTEPHPAQRRNPDPTMPERRLLFQANASAGLTAARAPDERSCPLITRRRLEYDFVIELSIHFYQTVN